MSSIIFNFCERVLWTKYFWELLSRGVIFSKRHRHQSLHPNFACCSLVVFRQITSPSPNPFIYKMSVLRIVLYLIYKHKIGDRSMITSYLILWKTAWSVNTITMICFRPKKFKNLPKIMRLINGGIGILIVYKYNIQYPPFML